MPPEARYAYSSAVNTFSHVASSTGETVAVAVAAGGAGESDGAAAGLDGAAVGLGDAVVVGAAVHAVRDRTRRAPAMPGAKRRVMAAA